MDVFRLLTLTYPRYVDSASREAVENTLHVLITRDVPGHKESELGNNEVLQEILDWLSAESLQVGKRGAARYVC